ncbi:MAG: hypothetical protein M1380_01510 [Chloroflexi bacterium]|nr:hypothetical protein [Chloroflexota bacterium]
MTLWLDVAVVFALNVPFGYWRGNVKKLSWQWILAIHVPVALAILVRLASHLPFEPVTLVSMVLAFFSGQTAGQRLRVPLAVLLSAPLTSWLPLDLLRLLMD